MDFQGLTADVAVALGEFEAAPSPVNLVHAGQPLLPLKLRAFLDFAAPLLKAGLSRSDFQNVRGALL